jgi:hypothetical protein
MLCYPIPANADYGMVLRLNCLPVRPDSVAQQQDSRQSLGGEAPQDSPSTVLQTPLQREAFWGSWLTIDQRGKSLINRLGLH